ncbi:MAG: hypothetical protein GY806_06095 [Gammaproteobacteria bacterium]|nr:hypothetical protein [Gammaproteobacteria bacterium]
MSGIRGKGRFMPIFVALSIGVISGYLIGINQVLPTTGETPSTRNLNQPQVADKTIKNTSVREYFSQTKAVIEKSEGAELSDKPVIERADFKLESSDDVSFGQSLTAEFIQLAASQLPQDVLLTYLDTATPFSKREFQTMNDPVSFAGKVAQLATGQELGFGSPAISNDSTITNFLVGEEFKEGENLSVIEPKTTRIFSYFELPNYTRNDVLVKWYYSDTNEILSFKRFSVNPESSKNYVWLDNQLGWVRGNYKVEIYSTDESLNLLSYGNYYVSE